MPDFATILKIVQGAAAAGPSFVALVDQVKTLFSDDEQTELQSALDAARKRSDDAQNDFVAAGRGN